MAEEGEHDAPEWVSNIEDESLKETLSSFESQEQFLEKIGYKPPEVETKDWREMIEDDEGKEFAKDSSDVNHLVKRALDMRKKLSNAVIKPGKDATPEQIKAYQKSLGVPESPEEYEFPEIPPEQLTDEVKEARKQWASKFHKMGVSKDAAKGFVDMLAEEARMAQEAQEKANDEYVKAQEEHLKELWGDDYDKNKTIAKRAVTEISDRAGVKLDDLVKLKTEDGRYLLDHPDIARIFAATGREMSEGSLGPVFNESELEKMEDEVRSVRTKIEEAKSKGDSKLANKLYQKEQALIAKMQGDKPIVGTSRAA